MTRNEAIEFIAQSVKSDVDMALIADAIKALEQEPTTKNDLGVDCISRADAIKAMEDKAKKLTNEDTINGLCGAVAILFDLPSVTPKIKPRKGYWIEDDEQRHVEKTYHCSECGHGAWGEYEKTEYCGGCGAKMFEPQESEDNNVSVQEKYNK